MKVISDNRKFESTLLRCIDQYDEIRIAVAWASDKTAVFQKLLSNKKKITTSTIGTHFYQTAPGVLKEFVGSGSVKFITQPSGVFHPKLYFFSTDASWEAIIGSANLTAGALGNNNELSLHITDKNVESLNVKHEFLKQIEQYFANAETVSKSDVETYFEMWKKQQPKLNGLSGQYSSDKVSKSPIHSDIMTMGWDNFCKVVKKDPYHRFDERVDLLEIIKNGFIKHEIFSSIPLDLRKTIAGLPNNQFENWGWFGSMSSFGIYHKEVINNNKFLSDALQEIDLNRVITREDYFRFIKIFKKSFSKSVNAIGTSSRLLAMKRPDIFVCLNSKNQSRMCKDFGIKISGMTYERYWDDLICRIQDSIWWNAEFPKDQHKQKIWNGRTALLDCLFYEM